MRKNIIYILVPIFLAACNGQSNIVTNPNDPGADPQAFVAKGEVGYRLISESKTNPDKTVEITNYGYDDSGYLVSEVYSKYDIDGRRIDSNEINHIYELGLRIKSENEFFSTKYSYHSGKLLQIDNTRNSDSFTTAIGFEQDSEGKLLSSKNVKALNSVWSFSYTYNDFSLASREHNSVGGQSSSSNFIYNANGDLIEEKNTELGYTIFYDYTDFGALQTKRLMYSDGSTMETTYSYDPLPCKRFYVPGTEEHRLFEEAVCKSIDSSGT